MVAQDKWLSKQNIWCNRKTLLLFKLENFAILAKASYQDLPTMKYFFVKEKKWK